MTVGRPGLPCRQKDLEAEAPQPLDGRTVERQGTAAGAQQLDPKALGRLDVQHRRQGDNGLHQNSSQPSSEAAGSSLRAAPPWPTVFMAVTVRLAGRGAATGRAAAVTAPIWKRATDPARASAS